MNASATFDSPAFGLRRLCRSLAPYALRRRRAMTLVLVTMALKIGLDLLKPWPMKVLADHVFGAVPAPAWLTWLMGTLPGAHTPTGLMYWCVGATLIAFLAAWAIGAASAVAHVNFGQRLAYDLAGDLFAHLQRMSLRFHSVKPTGDSIRRVTTDSAAITTIVQGALLPALSSIGMVVAMFIVLWQLNATLALLSLTIVPLILLALRRYAGPMLQAGYAQQEIDGKIYDVVEQTLTAMPVVQAYTREEEALSRFRQATRGSLAAALISTRVQYKYKIATGLATAIGTAAILWFGAYLVLGKRLTVGELLIFLSYLASLYAPIEALAYTSSTIQSASGSAARVMEILHAEPEIRDMPHATALPPPRGHIRLENVTFGYDPSRAVLRNVSLEVLPGQTVAIIGATGAGKSTLVGLVLRFFDPWQGKVLIDEHDLRTVRVKSVREQIAIVLQEPILFPITIAENIAYGRPEATPAEIEAAAVAANADAFIRALPEGYATPVGQRGLTLSGGERQRLSIARALLRDAPILILDEPTSALDSETEATIVQALGRLMAGRTTFVIAHRLSTIRHADRVVRLKDGNLETVDNLDELIREANAGASDSIELASARSGEGT